MFPQEGIGGDSGIQNPNQITMGGCSGPSILNPQPTRAAGAALLHEAIQSPSPSQALEHLDGDIPRCYTYEELHKASDAIAAQLAQIEDIGDGQFIVPVLIHQSPTLYAALLGILKAGGAFCPLNTDAPPERVNFILQDVSAKVLLVSKELASKLPSECPAKIIIAQWMEHEVGELVSSRSPSEKDLAYVMYTSGSTGTPKGVGISHSAVVNALHMHDRHFPQFARFLQFAAPTFDVSVFEIFFPLYRGSVLASARRSQMLDDLPRVMRTMQVDACELTPTVAGSLLKSRSAAPKLKLLLTIGEMLTEPVVKEFGGDKERNSLLWAMYGPTEATIHCTLQPAMAANSSVNNIGIPLDSVSVFIIQPQEEGSGTESFGILPQGQVGELAVGGYQLAEGYLNRNEQTAAAFIQTPHGRLYRTGDKARILPDGTIECFGRLSDGQVKLRGQRMELGEVQQAILRTPGCHGAVAAVQGSILVAFCAVDPDVLEDAILNKCKRWLPQFMVPGEIVLISKLPKLPSGKVDRQKLISDFAKQKQESQPPDRTNDDIPDDLLFLLSRLLSHPVQPSTILTTAGLDSLTAIQISSALREKGLNVDVTVLLRKKTVRDLWSFLQSLPNEQKHQSHYDIAITGSDYQEILKQNLPLQEMEHLIEDMIPCTHMQASMLAQTNRRPDLYWNEVELEVASPIPSIIDAFTQVMEKNEILRTLFVHWKDSFVSVVLKGVHSNVLLAAGDVTASQPELTNVIRPLRIQITRQLSNERSSIKIQIHHAIYDGWSMDMFLADVSDILEGSAPPVREQFRKIIELDYRRHHDADFAGAKDFWAGELLGWAKDPSPKLVGYSVDKLTPVVNRSFLEADLTDVDKFSVSLGFRPHVLFQASLALVWSGILGSLDIVLGTVTSGRTLPLAGIESIMGPCISSLPLRTNLNTITTVTQLLRHVQAKNLAMLDHSTIPLSDLRKLGDLQPGDDLYDVLFVYQQSPWSNQRGTQRIKEINQFDRLETKLLFEVEPRKGGFDIRTTHHPDFMTSEMALSIIRQVQTMALEIFKNPHQSITSIGHSLPSQLAFHNKAPTQFQGTPDLATNFEAMASKNPSSIALCFAKPGFERGFTREYISYAELNRMGNQIAYFILSSGLGTRQVVGIIMEKSILLYASILGIVKAGCAYLPLLPSTPIDRVREISVQAKLRHCLVDEASSKRFRALGGLRLLNVENAPLSRFNDENLQISVDGNRLAYVIYTSGTTGVPKGVAVTQLNIVSNINYLLRTYPPSQQKYPRLLQACSHAFDVSVFEIFFTWHAGFCLCAGTNDTVFEDLEHTIAELEVTHLSLTPTVATLVDPRKTPTVEFLVTAGEPLTQAVLDRWGSLLWQGYGPSETTNICSVKQMRRGMQIEHLGHAFSNTSTAVLTPGSLDSVPYGWVGELCFGGDQVAEGYLNAPHLTAERFTQHPKLGRIHRSGDLGRMLPDGSLVIIGRLDDQLKLRGQRIEAGEICALITGTGIATSAVAIIARKHERTPDQLIAFYVPAESTSGEGVLDIDKSCHSSIFSVLQSRLPSYMVPSYLIPLAKVPLTSSGKLHHRMLREWFKDLPSRYLEAAALSLSGDYTGNEWSSTESRIAETIKSHMGLGDEKVNKWASFATFGIDSVSAIALARRLGNNLGCRVPVSTIIQHPSVVQLGRCLDAVSPPASPASVSNLFSRKFILATKAEFGPKSRTVEAVLPCTPLQEAMLSGNQRSYYNKILFRLQVDADVIRQCWEVACRRHGILRTCFVATDEPERPIAQVVLRDWTIPWNIFDSSVASIDSVVGSHLQQLPNPVDSKIPPISLATFSFEGGIYLSFICHHALYDGVAMDNLWREIETLASDVSLPAAVPYQPFLRQMLTPPADTEDFWKAQMSGFRPSHLFANFSRNDVNRSITEKSFDMPLDEVQGRLRSLGATLISLCQSAWTSTLMVMSRSTDVCFGNVMSGRTIDVEGVDQLVAPCFNTLPLRADTSAFSQGHDLLKYFHQLNQDLLSYQFTPLRSIQKLAGGPGRKLFDTLLLLQKPLQNIDDQVWVLEEDSGDMDVPIVCEFVPCPHINKVFVKLHVDTNAVDSSTARGVLELLELSFQSLLKTPYEDLLHQESIPETLKRSLQNITYLPGDPATVESTPNEMQDWTEAESRIRTVIAKLSNLPLSKISRQTTIFQVGLDSINAVQVASLLRRKGLTVSATDVIEFPSCEKLAAHLDLQEIPETAKQVHAYNLVAFSHEIRAQATRGCPKDVEIEAILPATPIQCAMLTSFSQSNGKNYFNCMTYEIDTEVTMEQLVGSWETLASTHPMLRTGFVPVTHPHTTFAMVRYSPSSMRSSFASHYTKADEEDVQSHINRLSPRFLEEPYRPPWHLVFTQKKYSLFMRIVILHSLYDAASLNMLLDTLSRHLNRAPIHAFPDVEPAVSSAMSNSIGDHDEAEKFWRSKKEDAVVNKFPVMTPLRETVDKLETEAIKSPLSLSELQTACKEQDVSIQALIQASWTRVLASYLGERSVVFGVTFSGRSTEGMDSSPLPCLTTVPIIAQNFNSNVELLQYMMDYNAKMHKFQGIPLGQVQKWLAHPASPVFDTLVSYRKTKMPARSFKLTADDAQIDYPVSIEVEANDRDELLLSITYKKQILPNKQAALLLKQLDANFRHLILSPSSAEDELLQENLSLFSISPPEIPEMASPVRLMHEFVEMKARLQPDKIALEFADSLHLGSQIHLRSWTYRELDEMGNRVANLVSGVASVGSIIAVCFNKCPEAYFSILGVLKAGSSFVALDPTAPATRKEFILGDCNASALLFSSEDVLDFDTGSIPTTQISQQSLASSSISPCKLSEQLTPDLTCYCLYTSGTTGTPKGCEITHENAVQAMMAFQELFKGHWDSNSRWLQFAALHFDVSVLEQYWTWSVGMTVVAAPKDMILDDLTGSINKLRITHIDLTPSLARLTHPDEVPSLCRGVFITGGESLKQEILDVWGPKAVIYNAYGPTEATIGVTMYQRVPINGRPSNIGKQFPNVGSYVFRPDTNIPVPRGGVGELCVSGKLVGKGYLGRPELTAEKFPFLEDFGERVYRTGDLVRILHDGCFDFLGRADDQVKLRGQRLEIGEINHAIRGVPEIQDVATIVASSGDKSVLVSFLVSHASTKSKNLQVISDEEALGQKAKEACRNQLPAYMVPTYCLVLPFIPLSVNNKAETKELKRLFSDMTHEQLMKHANLSSAASRANVDSNLLNRIVDILAEFSGVEPSDITQDTSIFDIGLDSISVLRLSSLFKQRGFSHASPAKLLLNPIVWDLTHALSEVSASQPDAAPVREAKQLLYAYNHRYRMLACRELGLSADNIEYIAPCSPLQEGMVSTAFTSQESEAYFNSFGLKLCAGTDLDDVHKAFSELVASEPILRTVFLVTASGTIQVALKNKIIEWRTLDLDNDRDINESLRQQRQSWIDSNSSQIKEPLQFTVAKTQDGISLHINIFHSIYDGISLESMLARVAGAIKGEKTPHRLPFIDALVYGPLQNFEGSRSFWEEHLRDWVPSPLQLPHPPQLEGAAISKLELPVDSIENIRRTHNVTVQAVILALWISVLQQHHSSGLTIGLVVSGRSVDLPHVENAIGPLFNTLPFFNKTLRGHTWASLIRKCHDFGVSTLPFQHVPLHKVQKWCSHSKPLFDSLFTLQIETRSEDSDQRLWSVIDEEPRSEYPLALEVTYTRNRTIQLLLVAQSYMVDDKLLDEWLKCFERHHELMSSDPENLVPVDDQAETSTSSTQKSSRLNGHGVMNGFIWTPLATTMREQIASLAGVDPEEVHASTSLLELGIDSIDVMKLSARLRERGIMVPASQIMRLQTVAGISTSATESSVEDSSNQSFDLEKLQEQLGSHLQSSGVDLRDVETVLPATPLQESMVSSMIESDFEQYFNHDVLEIEEGTSLSKLRVAWDSLVDSMPILRTGFVEVEDPALDTSYCQVIWRNAFPWSEHLSPQETNTVDEAIEEAIQAAKGSKGLRDLLRLAFITNGPRNYLVVSIAHALYDGWSLSLMYQQLDQAYNGHQTTGAYTSSLFRQLLKPGSREAKEFWADYLQGAPSTSLQESPMDIEGHDYVNKTEIQSKIDVKQIYSTCKKLSISLQALCQGCWAIVLAYLNRQLDVTYGVIMSGRDFDGADKLVFPTMNTVAARYLLHGSTSTFLQYIEETLGDVREHQHYPLRKALAAAGSRANGLFNTLFLLQKAPESESTDLLLKSVKGQSAVDYPVCVEAELIGDRFYWRAACQSRYVSKSGVSELISNLDQVMEFLIGHTESEILSFSRGQVSICGLPYVQLKPSDESNKNEDEYILSEMEWDETTSTIRDILSQISGVPSPEVQISNSLYHLGLDSISAVKAAALLRRNGVQVRPRDLIKADSIHHMGRLASTGEKKPQENPTGARTALSPPSSHETQDILRKHDILAHDVVAVTPALPMQVYMLGMWQNYQGSVFHPEFTYLCHHDCSRDSLRSAWDVVVRSTPVLQTCFVAAADGEIPVLQVILKSTAVASNATVQPPVKLSIDWDDTRRAWLMRLKIHHALYDGVSLPAIMQKLSRILTGSSHDTYQDNNHIERWLSYTTNQATATAKATRKDFWSSYLSGCSARRSEPSGTSYPIGRVSLIQRSALRDTTHVQRMAAQYGVSIQALFMAAYAKVIYEFAGVKAHDCANGQGDPHDAPVVFGIYLANQSGDDPDQELPAIYPRLNLVPLKVDVRRGGVGVDDGGGLAEVAGRIQRDLLEIRSNGREHVGLWEIDDWTGVKISSFVNFLTLPDIEDRDDGHHVASKIRLAGDQDSRVASHSIQDNSHGLGAMGNIPVRDSFLPALDVEASLHDGTLDIGAFGPSNILPDEDTAAELVRRLVVALQSI